MQDSHQDPKRRMIWPLPDAVCALRSRWRAHHEGLRDAQDKRGSEPRGSKVGHGDGPGGDNERRRLVHESQGLLTPHPQARVYPYTKGIDLTNEGLGYGEEVEQQLASIDGASLRPVPVVSRRTRSGRQRVVTRDTDGGEPPPSGDRGKDMPAAVGDTVIAS